MNYTDAMRIAKIIQQEISPACLQCVIAGSLRRRSVEVHDIEFVIEPKPGRPAPKFGQGVIHTSYLDKLLYEMQDSGMIRRVKGGEKYKQYEVCTPEFDLPKLVNPFHVEFWVMTPPAQFGVGMVIRTGPGKPGDNFSKWCVTHVSSGGGLPDNYQVRHLAVWNEAQGMFKKGKFEPLIGAQPIGMPQEIDFLDFLGLGWIEPTQRHAKWRRS